MRNKTKNKYIQTKIEKYELHKIIVMFNSDECHENVFRKGHMWEQE